MYQAGSWKYPRRVVFKIEKPYGQLTHMYTFIVTNMDMEPYQIIQFYCGRGESIPQDTITFKLCSSCPYKKEFYRTLENIQQLFVQLE